MSDRADRDHRKRGKSGPGKRSTTRQRDDRSSATLVFPTKTTHNRSRANVRNTDTWKLICHWLPTIDLVALLMTGNRWMQNVVADTRDVKWVWYYYPILHMFTHITTVDVSLDYQWPPLLSAIAALPPSVTTLTLKLCERAVITTITSQIFDDAVQMPVVLPPLLTTLNLTTPASLLMFCPVLPDSLTQLMLDISDDPNTDRDAAMITGIVREWLHILPATVTHLDLQTRTSVSWSIEDVSALPRSLLNLSINVAPEAVIALPPQLLSLDLRCDGSYEETSAIIALLPRTLTSLVYYTYFRTPEHWDIFTATLPPNLTELHTNYYDIADVSAFQRYPLKKLTLFWDNNQDRCYYQASDKVEDQGKLVLLELDSYFKPWDPIPVTVTRLFTHTHPSKTPATIAGCYPYQYQFRTLDCMMGNIGFVPDSIFFRYITTLNINNMSVTDDVLQVLKLVNRQLLVTLCLSGSFRIRLEPVMLAICGVDQSHLAGKPGSIIGRFTALRVLLVDFMNDKGSRKLDSYTYHKRIELPQGLERFTITGCSTFKHLIFPRSLISLMLDGIMVPYPSLAQMPRLQRLIWSVHSFGVPHLDELITYLPPKLRELTVMASGAYNIYADSQMLYCGQIFNDMVLMFKAQRTRYLKNVTFE